MNQINATKEKIENLKNELIELQENLDKMSIDKLFEVNSIKCPFEYNGKTIVRVVMKDNRFKGFFETKSGDESKTSIYLKTKQDFKLI